MRRGPNNRAEALDKLDRVLNEANLAFSCGPKYPSPKDKNEWLWYGPQAWEIARNWNLKEELANHKNRDFAIMNIRECSFEPQNPKRLLKLAVCVGEYRIILRYSQHLNLKLCKLILTNVGSFPNGPPKELISMLQDCYPIMNKSFAKIILKNGFLVHSFYQNISHFGSKLYYWSYKVNEGSDSFYGLIDKKCPADIAALNLAITRPIPSNIQHIFQFTQPNEESQEIMDREFSHWLFYTKEELLQGYAKYGVDPMTVEDEFPRDSFDYQIRLWFKVIRGKNFYYHSSYRREFQICLPRIKEAEPKVYERLMLLEP